MENQINQKSLVSFIDASGTLGPNDRYFGVGMLTVELPGPLTDKLHPVFQRVMAISQANRNQAVASLIQAGRKDEVITMLKQSKRFELKFDRVTPVKFDQYKEMIRIFLSYPGNRFVTMVVDRHHPSYDKNHFSSTWEAYTSYVAVLVANELSHLPDKEMFVVLDELPKPKIITQSLEEVIMEKVDKRCGEKYSKLKICTFKNAIRIESHSNLLMQLCDVLLGAVMFDYKQSSGKLSDKLQNRKEEVVKILRQGLGQPRLDALFKIESPVYFQVWHPAWHK